MIKSFLLQFYKLQGKALDKRSEEIKEKEKKFQQLYRLDFSWQEQQALCGNFIVFDRTIVVSGPETPTSFIEKMYKLHFDFYGPAN